MRHTNYLDYPAGTTFAIWPFDPISGQCGCGDDTCTDAGKHPRLKTKPKPGEGYGIMLGSIENGGCGYFAVDIDDPAAVLPGPLSHTRTHHTGRFMGKHVLYLHPGAKRVKNSRSTLAKGVDVKGDGGWIVGPGSPHVSGRTYEIADASPVARAPQWLLDWPGLYREETGAAGEHSPEGLKAGTPAYDRAVKVLEDYCKTTPNTDGSNALLAVGHTALRCEIAPSDALPIVMEHFNPRATNSRTGEGEWQEWEIEHKLTDTWQNIYNMPTGVGWMADDLGKRLATPPVLKIPHIEGSDSALARRVRDPNHVYVFVPGYDQPDNDRPRKATCFDLVHLFTQGPAWTGVFQYDELAEREIAVNPPLALDMERKGQSRTDLAKIQVWLVCHGLLAGIDAIGDAVSIACRRCSFHPVREYLNTLPTVDVAEAEGYLMGLAREWFGDKCGPQEATYLTRFLVGAVKRIYNPGEEMQNMIVLYGDGNLGKSRWVKQLFGTEHSKSQMPTLEGRDASHALRGMWAVEIGELASLLRTETSAVKEFLSRSVDQYRQYGNGSEVISPRQCVMVGTTNEPQFLRDSTGNRRFWPIHVTCKIPAGLDRDAAWASAKSLALAGYKHWEELEESIAAEATKGAYVEVDPWHEKIADFLKGKERVRAVEIWAHLAPGGGVAQLDGRTQRRIVDTLRRLGCTDMRTKVAGVTTRFWEVPQEIREAKAHLQVVK